MWNAKTFVNKINDEQNSQIKSNQRITPKYVPYKMVEYFKILIILLIVV